MSLKRTLSQTAASSESETSLLESALESKSDSKSEAGKIALRGHNEHFIVQVNDKNLEVYINLARSYEAEFSNLTHKEPNELGIFEPDTMPIHPYTGFLLYRNNTPVGFCVVKIDDKLNDVAEFYIIPAVRKNKLGHTLATTIFDMYPGNWQVRQISGADVAISFWRKVIGKHTQNQYTESVITDPDWGVVTRQKFEIMVVKKNDKNPSLLSSNDRKQQINDGSQPKSTTFLQADNAEMLSSKNFFSPMDIATNTGAIAIAPKSNILTPSQ